MTMRLREGEEEGDDHIYSNTCEQQGCAVSADLWQ